MSNIVNINGKNFLNDYIDFTTKSVTSRYTWQQVRYNLPESECLIHIWQNSNDLAEFWDNMVSAYDYWKKENPEWWFVKDNRPLVSRGYKRRIQHLRKKGVKLKTYSDEHKTIQYAIKKRNKLQELQSEVERLQSIAAITIT